MGVPRNPEDLPGLSQDQRCNEEGRPSVDELVDSLHGKKLFSSIDLMQSYHQQELTERSKEFTAFNAGPIGFFEYTRLSIGRQIQALRSRE